MSLQNLRESIPDYAKDIRLNLGTLASDPSLSEQQKWGCFYASALATGQADVTKNIHAEIAEKLSEEAKTAAKSAAAIMAMNNVYYRATHLMADQSYQTLPAKLRMNVIGKPGVDKIDFELWSFAVSAVNGCGMCLDSHEKVLRTAGMTTAQVQTALRIAATVNAAANVMQIESIL